MKEQIPGDYTQGLDTHEAKKRSQLGAKYFIRASIEYPGSITAQAARIATLCRYHENPDITKILIHMCHLF